MIKKEIKKMRKSRNINQQELSEMVYSKQNTISQYESGKRAIDSDKLENITEALEYSMKFIKNEDVKKIRTIKTFNHLELIKEMDSKILDLTGISMDFEFELSFDGKDLCPASPSL